MTFEEQKDISNAENTKQDHQSSSESSKRGNSPLAATIDVQTMDGDSACLA